LPEHLVKLVAALSLVYVLVWEARLARVAGAEVGMPRLRGDEYSGRVLTITPFLSSVDAALLNNDRTRPAGFSVGPLCSHAALDQLAIRIPT
jgi:hypothetical protein